MKKVLLFVVVALFAAGYSEGAFAKEKPEAKVDFYGEIVFNSFYSNNYEGGATTNAFQFNLSDSTKLGANFEYGNFGVVAEIGSAEDSIIRLAYAQYTFNNGGVFSVGQNENIAFYNFGQASDNGNALINYGTLGDVRRPMLKYSISGFNVALIAGDGVSIMGQDESVGYLDDYITDFNSQGANVKKFEWIPRVEASYDIESDIFNGSVFAGYAAYLLTSETTANGNKDYNINSYSVGFGGQFTFGDAFIDLTAYYGMNLFLTSALSNSSIPLLALNQDYTLTVDNVQSAGGALGIGYQINEIFTPQIGAGYSVSFGGPLNRNDDAWAVYANVAIQVNSWLAFVPEVAYTSRYSDVTNNVRENALYAGFQTLVTF